MACWNADRVCSDEAQQTVNCSTSAMQRTTCRKEPTAQSKKQKAAHLCSCFAGYQHLPSFQCLQVIHRDGALVRALSNCKELLVGGHRQSGDALAFWRARSEPLHLCLDIVGHHSVSDRVYNGVLLDEVDIVLDISSQTEDMPATKGSGQA